MKRGFLLRAEARKVAAKRRGPQKQKDRPSSSTPAASEPSQHCKREGEPTSSTVEVYVNDIDNLDLAEKLAANNLADKEKALASDYDLVITETDPRIIEFKDNTLVVTTIPGHSGPDDETQCEWIVNGSTKGKVINAPGYLACIPQPRCPGLFEVRSTSDMGKGVFAKRNIKGGNLIFAERPLLVSPEDYTAHPFRKVTVFEYESLLEKTIGRMSDENQADFRELHTGDWSGPLLGIIKSNGYGIGKLYDGSNENATYKAVCKIGSRINHSCMPNVMHSFKLNSFSSQFYAIRDINPGEQLFCSYCKANRTLAQRRTEIAPYGFVCKCPACVKGTPQTDQLRKMYGTQIAHFEKKLTSPSALNKTAVENAVKLEKAMVKEGLDVEFEFVTLLKAICLAYTKLGKTAESQRYSVLVEGFHSCRKDDD